MLRLDAQRARRRPGGAGRHSALAWLLPALAASAAGFALANGGVLATVGSISIDASSFRQRAARVGALDWRELGATWPERRRRFLDEVLIAEALLALAAERAPPALPSARDRALARTLDAAIVQETSQLAPSDADVRAYRERHTGEFQTPRALGIWRILLATEAEARAVIAELAKPSADAFSRLARERSIDRATHMRAGNLGLVAADGQTAVPELRVSPALFAAADRVGDGELVPEPVREGDHFAVVWRRGTRAATAWPDAEMAATIAARLAETRASTARQRLLETLRRDHLAEYHPEAAAAFEPSFPETKTPRSPRRLDAVEPPRAAPPRVRPELTDRGLR
jgi:peptidyl-prolyl cis-trans isomerase C